VTEQPPDRGHLAASHVLRRLCMGLERLVAPCIQLACVNHDQHSLPFGDITGVIVGGAERAEEGIDALGADLVLGAKRDDPGDLVRTHAELVNTATGLVRSLGALVEKEFGDHGRIRSG